MTVASITPASGECEANPCGEESPRRYRVEVDGMSAILCGSHASGVKNGYDDLEELLSKSGAKSAPGEEP